MLFDADFDADPEYQVYFARKRIFTMNMSKYECNFSKHFAAEFEKAIDFLNNGAKFSKSHTVG